MVTLLKTDDVLEILDLVKDPEIPVVSVRDMGIIRRIEEAGGRLKIVITPTYSGCPAMEVIERDIAAMLKLHGLKDFDVETEISPAWTTDWITEEGRRKLQEYGIAPPANSSKAALLGHETVACPQCGSPDTVLVSEFGSTACKALYKCNDCLETFDYFKCV
ncbi:1,2-phenylacetyl-CoA epoxidase subunit PaaD [uncultured Sneathiella sp.]|jgi:ring-1,2-phenylacetyl-CoA epoxidase subunit PaaD|uniref:1,2-phenylacetyl-CoA epoxidase subunit PaaD n=1 Tax=uncultured Sneathiella sp. TaxID=879315 RepID=UPI0030DD31C0|tara:strand:- start:3246 stop:3731 length:486 start_codon:yes stop_codon:yes gene_type:complete